MNEQDEKLLELYLKDARKKKVFFIVIAIFLIGSILFYGFYAKYKQSSNDMDNSIQEEIETNIINENTTNEENIDNVDNTTVEENTEKQDKVDETPKENTNKVLILSFKYIKTSPNYRNKITTIIKDSYYKLIKILSLFNNYLFMLT